MKLFREELNEDVLLADSHRAHRIGKKRVSSSKPRPAIVKFARYNTRQKVFKSKRKLKGKNIIITENLTGYRMGVLNKAREKLASRMYGHTTDGFYIKITMMGKR